MLEERSTGLLEGPMNRSLLLVGFGNVADHLYQAQSVYGAVYATTRKLERFPSLRQRGIEPLILAVPPSDEQSREIERLSCDADVLVSYPPTPDTDEKLAAAINRSARRLVYISSTGVYGDFSGVVDDSTPVDRFSKHSESRLKAEDLFLQTCDAVVLRAPALYGPGYGLHKSLESGKYRLPGDGATFSSRIHLEDLARIVLEVFETDITSGAYLVGDSLPASKRDVVAWLCERMSLPMPESVPLDSVHHTLRADRRVDSSALLKELSLELKYPTYIEGFSQCIAESRDG